MKKNITLFIPILILLQLLFGQTLYSQKKKAPDKPKLIVLIVVEQMRYDYLYRFNDKFSDFGIKKLLENGYSLQNANYNYMLTQSAAGYSTIATGAEPASHSIVGNTWYNRLGNRSEFCTYDAKINGLGSQDDDNKMSPKKLRATTFSDELRISNFKQSKVIGISAYNYSAVLPAGHLANGAFKIDPETGKWVSSTYYYNKLPSWVKRFNNKDIIDIYSEKIWNTFYKTNKYTESLPDNNSYEKGFEGNNRTFPYQVAELKASKGNYDAVNYTPYGNTYVKDFAISAIVNEDLGKDEFPDFLSVSFSANANISKLFNIRSVELEDMYIRLDKDLAHFIKFTEEYVGKENVLIILSSDRGATDSPDFLKDIRIPGGYFNESSGISLLNSYLRAIYGQGDWINSYFDQQIYLNRDLIEKKKLTLEEVQQTSASFLINLKGVANAISSTTLEKTNFTSGIAQKIQNSYNQERSGDVIINLSPGWAVKGSKYDKFTHKRFSGYHDDTHVPLIFYGWKIKKGSSSENISMTDIAPTLSLILNISFPNASTGKPIQNMIKQ